MWIDAMLDHYMTLNFDPTHDVTLDFLGQILKELYFRNGWVMIN